MVKDEDSQTPSVLVVDANARHRLLYEMEIEAQGYEVVCARDGQEALRQVQHRYFDVAVIDILLPDINGKELVKAISTRRQNLPIIINTAYAYRKSHFRHWAVEAVIMKSSDLNELLNTIASALQFHRSQKISEMAGHQSTIYVE